SRNLLISLTFSSCSFTGLVAHLFHFASNTSTAFHADSLSSSTSTVLRSQIGNHFFNRPPNSTCISISLYVHSFASFPLYFLRKWSVMDPHIGLQYPHSTHL